MPKKKSCLSLLLLMICLVWGCAGNRIKPEQAVMYQEGKELIPNTQVVATGSKLNPGEYYFYRVNWLGLHVGTASVEIKELTEYKGRQCYRILMQTQTNNFFAAVYKVVGTIESYVDAETLQPRYYYSETTINKKFVYKEMTYDYDKKKIYAKDKKGEYEIDLVDKIIDPMGFFYFFRTHEVNFEQPIEVLINGGKKNYPITIFVHKEKRLNTPAGPYWVFLAKPTETSERQFDEALNAPGALSIWYSSDEKRVPVMITLKVPIGTAVAMLSEVQKPAACPSPAD